MRRFGLVLLVAAIGALAGWLVAASLTVCTVYADAPSLDSFCEVELFGWTTLKGAGVTLLVGLGIFVGAAIGAHLVRRRSAA